MPTRSCTSNNLTPSCCTSDYLTSPCAQNQHYAMHRCTSMCNGNSSSSYLLPNNHVIDHHYYKQLDVYCEITDPINTSRLPPVRDLPPLPNNALTLNHVTSSREVSGEYGVLFPTQDTSAAAKTSGKLTTYNNQPRFVKFFSFIIVQNEIDLRNFIMHKKLHFIYVGRQANNNEQTKLKCVLGCRN
jgi:hypothetical protein